MSKVRPCDERVPFTTKPLCIATIPTKKPTNKEKK